MPEFILSNFPEELPHKLQVHLEALQEDLLPQAKYLEGIGNTFYYIHIISGQGASHTKSVNIAFELPVKAFTIRQKILQSRSNLSKYLVNIHADAINELKITEIRFETKDKHIKNETSTKKQPLKVLDTITPRKPLWSFSQVISPETTIKEIERAVAVYENRFQLFEEWGLKILKPQSSVLINLYGSPGTGKTMIAHAIANRLDLPIIELSYAQIESKYVGDGPKNIRSVFETAMKENSLIFFDEADSLLGKRVKNLIDSADQAVNSMRSQMIIEMDKFSGVAVFATNLIENYDRSFRGRLNSINIPLPNKKLQAEILRFFLHSSKIPGAQKISLKELNKLLINAEGLSGRDLRDALILAATEISLNKSADLKAALNKTIKEIANIRTTEQKKGD